MRKIYAICKLAVINIALLAVLLVICEVLVRKYAQQNQTFEERSSYIVNYIASGYTRFQIKPNQKICAYINGEINKDSVKFNINSLGYRGDDIPLKKDSGEIRIAIIGGSHVFEPNCFDYETHPGFPKLLENKLKGEGLNVRVINAGVPGSSTKEQLMRLYFDISKYQPDYVVINSIWNDIKWIRGFTTQMQIASEKPKAVDKNPLTEPMFLTDYLLGWSVIYRKLHDFYWNRKLGVHSGDQKISEGVATGETIEKNSPAVPDYKDGYNQYRNNLLLLIDIAKQFKAVPVLAIEESLISTNNTEEEKKDIRYEYAGIKSHNELVANYDECIKITKQIAVDNGLKVIDAGSEIKSVKYFVDQVHMTPEGSDKVAHAYAVFFENLLKQKQKTRYRRNE